MKYINDNQIDRDKLMNDYTIQWAVTTPLYNIGENVYNISSEFKEAYKDIPWNMIAGLRHRLVHNYEGTNWSIIADVVFKELPEFKEQVDQILLEE